MIWYGKIPFERYETEATHSALSRLDEIFDSQKGDKHFNEAQLLVLLIEKYETETEPEFENPDPIETINIQNGAK